MKRLLIIQLILFNAFFGTAQIYSDYIGAGHHEGITVTASHSMDSTAAINTITAKGMDAPLYDAARFLSQAALGFDLSTMQAVRDQGDYGQWIQDQLNLPITYTTPRMNSIIADIYQMRLDAGVAPEDLPNPNWLHFTYAWWHNQMTADDLLRQRMAFALSQIFVISYESGIRNYHDAFGSYYDLLLKNSFGNYKDLLTDITLHPAMGLYLSHLNNPKAIPAQNIHPDENYAREIMQLFSIGLYELNNDGSQKLDTNGDAIPTYDNDDIKELAKVFTGLAAGAVDSTITYTSTPYFGLSFHATDKSTPMAMYDSWHEPGIKVILKKDTIPDGQPGMTDIDQLIDILFNHDNVGPFFSTLLIKRLVKSNPSPAYVNRVVNVFNNNGLGVRGDLAAVLEAILMDEEARDVIYQLDYHSGRLKEPMVRFLNMAKSLPNDSPFGRYWSSGYDFREYLLQHIFGSKTVFNFYLPDYEPIGDIQSAGLVAPEFQIHNTASGVYYFNRVYKWTHNRVLMQSNELNYGDVKIYLNYDSLEPMAENPERLINELDKRLTYGMLTDETRTFIRDAITPLTGSSVLYNRVRLATYLIMISPDYSIIR